MIVYFIQNPTTVVTKTNFAPTCLTPIELNVSQLFCGCISNGHLFKCWLYMCMGFVYTVYIDVYELEIPGIFCAYSGPSHTKNLQSLPWPFVTHHCFAVSIITDDCFQKIHQH